jgi:hypothetical protein
VGRGRRGKAGGSSRWWRGTWKWIRQVWRENSAVTLVIVFLVALALMSTGYYEYLSGIDKPAPPVHRAFEAAYKSLLAFAFGASDTGVRSGLLEWGRWLAVFVAIMVGWQAVAAILTSARRTRRAARLKGHTIICGHGELGSAIAEMLHEDGQQVVVIEQTELSSLGSVWRRGGSVVVGDAADPFVLVSAGLRRASRLIVCCGHDDRNATIAATAVSERLEWARPASFERVGRESRSPLGATGRRAFERLLDRLAPWSGPISIHVHIDNPRLLERLRPYALSMCKPGAHVNFFNIGDIAARQLVEAEQDRRRSVGKGETIEFDTMIVGSNWLAESLAVQTIRAARAKRPDTKHRVLLAGPGSQRFMERLIARYVRIEDATDLTAHDIQMDAADMKRDEMLFVVDGDRTVPRFAEAFVCLLDDLETMTVALTLSDLSMRSSEQMRIAACVYGRSGLAEMMKEATAEVPFEVFDAVHAVVDSELTDVIEVWARAIHQDYYRREKGRPKLAAVPWEVLPEHFRDQNRGQALEVFKQIKSIGYKVVPLDDWASEGALSFDEDQIEHLAEAEHARWMRQKEGGPSTDEELKTHRDLIDWRTLNATLPEDAELDRAAIRLIPELLAAVGLTAVSPSPRP